MDPPELSNFDILSKRLKSTGCSSSNMAGFASLVNLQEEGCPVTRGRRIQISQMGLPPPSGTVVPVPAVNKASKSFTEESSSGNMLRKRWSFHSADQIAELMKEDKSLKPIFSPKRRKPSNGSSEVTHTHKGPLSIVVDGKNNPLAGPSSKQSTAGSKHLLASQQQSQHRHSHRHHHQHQQRRSSSGKVLATRAENDKGTSSSSSVKQRYLNDFYAMQVDAASVPSTYQQFKMRQKQKTLIREPPPDYISQMPDEILLRVFKFLPKVALANLARTSHRFLGVIQDDSLWKRLCIMTRLLSPEHLFIIMQRRPVYLRMARAHIPDPIEIPTESALSAMAASSQLTYLDLTSAMISPQTLALIMRISPKIIKLSLEHLQVTKEVLESMMPLAPKIEELNITMCYEVDPATLARFLGNCQSLKQLNMGCLSAPHWTRDDLTAIVTNLPPSLEQLNIAGFRNILDNEHAETIVTRCLDLIELDVSDSAELQGKCIPLILQLQKLQHLSFSRCYGIEPQKYFDLKAHPTLKFLNLFSLFKETSLRQISSHLQGIEINKFPLSAIARPTVGNKRSSIWGQRVRD